MPPAWWNQDLKAWTGGWAGGSGMVTVCSQPAALSVCHRLMIIPGTWQPQLGTWHNQPVTQTPTWDCHQFSCQTEIRTQGPWRAWVRGIQAQGPVDGSPGSRQFSKMFLVLCISSKALGRRLSNGQKWFQDYRLTFLTSHTISISFKAVGVGEDVKTRSFGADGKAAQNCLPILAPTPSSGIGNPFLGSLL